MRTPSLKDEAKFRPKLPNTPRPKIREDYKMKMPWDPVDPSPSSAIDTTSNPVLDTSLPLDSKRGPEALEDPIKRGPEALEDPIKRGPEALEDPIKRGPEALEDPIKRGPEALEDPIKRGPEALESSTTSYTPHTNPIKRGPLSTQDPIKRGPLSTQDPIKRGPLSTQDPIKRGPLSTQDPIKKGSSKHPQKGSSKHPQKGSSKHSRNRRANQQEKILGYLAYRSEEFAKEMRSAVDCTGWITRSEIAEALETTANKLHCQLKKMKKKGWLEIVEFKPGINGGARYRVLHPNRDSLPRELFWSTLKRGPLSTLKRGPLSTLKRGPLTSLLEEEDLSTSSSREHKGTTTRLEEMIRGYGFGEEPTLKASGLVHWQNQDHFAGPEHFLGAVAVVLCRWAQNPELPKRLRDLNATLSSELQKPASAQPPPEGFETWQERQERLWVERSKAGADRALERRTERLSAQADAWVQAGPSDEELRALVGSEAFAVLQKTGSRISLMKAARQAKFEQLQGEEVLPAPLSGSEA